MIGFILSFILFFSESHAEGSIPTHCNEPSWVAPAQSQNGVFTGDLQVECKIPPLDGAGTLPWVRMKMIEKIDRDTIVHQKPTSEMIQSGQPLQWDVSHRFKESEGGIVVRESLNLSSLSQQSLVYETESKEIDAPGLASFLKSIHFSMRININSKNEISIVFRNRVQVQRPWYALDLLFAPIARKVCFEKMEQVKNNFLPWFHSVYFRDPSNSASIKQ